MRSSYPPATAKDRTAHTLQLHYAFVTRVAGNGFAEVTELNGTVAIETALYGRQFVKT